MLHFRLACKAILVTPILMGIAGLTLTPVAAAPGQAEPTGGQWKPVVIKSGDVIPLPPPPDRADSELAGEMRELRVLQGQRTPKIVALVNFWNTGAVVRWNEIARSLVVKHKTTPPQASRVYALLSVAQFDALIGAWHHKYLYGRQNPSRIDKSISPLAPISREPVYPSEYAVVAGASAAILEYLYPGEEPLIENQVRACDASRLWAGVCLRSDITAGDILGRLIAQQVINQAKTDRSNAVWRGTVPTGAGMWTGTNPVLPLWGNVRPWLMTSVRPFRPAPPPAYNSPEFQRALAEVRYYSDHRTPEQLRIAKFWADGAGTYTPPGHWNAIACDMIVSRTFNELRAARTLALMNMAVMDAGICCWDAKYAYWLLRPYQVDPSITTPVGKPNFPSYTSGHATFSGAASKVLSYIFPDRKRQLEAMADEAAMSRVYGGIHFRFDSDIGLAGGNKIGDMGIQQGRAIANLAVQRGMSDGSPQ